MVSIADRQLDINGCSRGSRGCLNFCCLSCHAFKLGMGSEQDARTTRILQFLTLWFKCRTVYCRKIRRFYGFIGRTDVRPYDIPQVSALRFTLITPNQIVTPITNSTRYCSSNSLSINVIKTFRGTSIKNITVRAIRVALGR